MSINHGFPLPRAIVDRLRGKRAVSPQNPAKSLTFVVAETEVALPSVRVDEDDKRVDVGATRATADDDTRLDDWQVLQAGTQH